MPPPYPTRSLTMNQVSRYRGALSTQGNRFISISSSLVILLGEFSTSESRSAHASMQPSSFRIEFIESIGA